ncbi:MAG: hypothetical protein WAL95_04865 [Candidatus Acidiferrales bacterium]
MEFTVVKSEDENDRFAPWQVLIDGQEFLSGIELESEAWNICRVLELAPPATSHPEKIVMMNKRSRFIPKRIEKSKLEQTRRFLGDPRGTA